MLYQNQVHYLREVMLFCNNSNFILGIFLVGNNTNVLNIVKRSFET